MIERYGKSHLNEFWIEPSKEDLGDLFNYAFNLPNSCFNPKYKINQASYIFLAKFKGTKGLIKFLKTRFGEIYLETILPESVHYRKNFDFSNSNGIIGDEKDI